MITGLIVILASPGMQELTITINMHVLQYIYVLIDSTASALFLTTVYRQQEVVYLSLLQYKMYCSNSLLTNMF